MIDVPVVDPWYSRERVDDAVTRIFEPHVHRFLRCNVWVVRGRSRHLVIDTALGVAPLRALVESEVEGELLAVATHTHADHIGQLHEFPQRAAHPAEAAALDAATYGSIETAHYGDAVDTYRAAGYEFGPLLVDAAPPGGFAATVFEVRAAPVTRMLHEGDVLDLGDRAFEVLHLPGHSPGSIGLWDATRRVLFSGDALYDGPLLDALDGSDIGRYVETIRRLRALPVEVVHAGHEASFGRERLVELCDAYLLVHEHGA